MPTLGIFLDARVLRQVVRRRPTFEAVHLYERAAREMDLDLVLFCPQAINRRRRRIGGHAVPGFRSVVFPPPPVVHNRTLQYPSSVRDVRWLERQGVKVFNPIVAPGKHAKHLILSRSPAVRPHLPAAFPLSRRRQAVTPTLLGRSGRLFVKPDTGSLGRGVVRVTRAGERRFVLEGGRKTVTGERGLRRHLLRLARRGPHLLQEGISLAQYRGRPFDLRVHLQRGESGRWMVPGMGVRRAGGSFVTNLTRGGSAHRTDEVLPSAFPALDPQAIRREVVRVSLAAGEAMARGAPGVADLGLDVGLDETAHPWILEVNLRELRFTPRDTGEHEVWAELYRNPVAYARHLMAGATPGVNLPVPPA